MHSHPRPLTPCYNLVNTTRLVQSGNQGSEKSPKLPRVTQLVGIRAKMQGQVSEAHGGNDALTCSEAVRMRPPRVAKAPSSLWSAHGLGALHHQGKAPPVSGPESLLCVLPLGYSHTRALPGKLGTQDEWRLPPLSPEGTNCGSPGHSSSCYERRNLFLPTVEIPLQRPLLHPDRILLLSGGKLPASPIPEFGESIPTATRGQASLL